jgi:hypothetical protein
VINLSSRLYFIKRSYSLDSIKFFAALCRAQLDFSLPWRHFLVALPFIIATFIPGALWAGAITPVTSSTTQSYTIDLAASASPWSTDTDVTGNPLFNTTLILTNAKGIFTVQPAYDLGGSLLDSASKASISGNETVHAKLDLTRYSYVGRSYGIGASSGLTDEALSSVAAMYTYYESGLDTSISCTYNDTPIIKWYNLTVPDGWTMRVWEVNG